MPQFNLDDAIVEGDLLVEEVTCNMIEPDLIDDRDQDLEKFHPVAFPDSDGAFLLKGNVQNKDDICQIYEGTCSNAQGCHHDIDLLRQPTADESQCSSAPFYDNTVLSQMAPCSVKMHEDSSEGKNYVDSFEGNPQREEPLTSNEGISSLCGCECSGLNLSNNPLQKIPKGQPEIWCLFGTQIVKTLLDTGVYRSLIKPTVLERIQKDAILAQDDEIHTLCCANKTTKAV